jgi:hypothetical protein
MFRQFLYSHGEAPRRRVSMNPPVRNAGGVYPLDHTLGQGGGQAQQRARRQLLGAELE